MLNGRFLSSVRVVTRWVVLIASFSFTNGALWGQSYYHNPYDAGIGLIRLPGYPAVGSRSVFDQVPDFSAPPPSAPAGTVSTDVLRNPLSTKARSMLEKAMHFAEMGDHAAAINSLHDTLAKHPAAAPYVHNLLGIEYLETRQTAASLAAFEEALRAMPHESIAHSNVGLSLAMTGKLDLAETELRKAIRLDHTNSLAKRILEAVLVVRRAPKAPAAAAGTTP